MIGEAELDLERIDPLAGDLDEVIGAAAMSAIALTLGSLRSQGRLIENSICGSAARKREREKRAPAPKY